MDFTKLCKMVSKHITIYQFFILIKEKCIAVIIFVITIGKITSIKKYFLILFCLWYYMLILIFFCNLEKVYLHLVKGK